ncbi:hypothetical protein T484DRAFT_2660436 [Baffinella frigidus]|nr:hypothetical protein T484DRAFT_2660436 [Cryptophyta sp. CCMP2293]
MGFDGAEGDVGNSHLHLDGNPGGLDLRGEDYAWATDEICAVADRCCDGRVVSVLEGGYGMPERRVVNGVNVNSLDRTALGARNPNPESRIPNPESRIPKSETQNPKPH